ncbi:glutamate 5-kinase-like protein [Plenodomus tracheiphilus IPT5]|uniref:Glutamate 5-kinase-like protein n=1 Tax=Plenodomus tracheiphilus IPT5 TaxID=1408161 RepID=A0A6A7AUP9_9PLEO|nr:glutamate 5-kinase-like protein [Plenodomus tracheiphilus IPT5]
MAVHMRKQPGQLTVVIKLGTSSIVDEKTHQPLLSILSLIVETACNLNAAGHHVVIVSSGAIGVGLRRMNLPRRPKHLPKVQALAAIGQCKLISLWDQLFGNLGQPIAQVLLTRNDIADRTQYQNAQNTFIELLSMGVIPIVNENDTLAVSEIKFGDNDTLSAITAGMVQADYLFLMTDVDCLYDKNPRTNPDAKSISVVEDIAELAADVSSAGSALGTGGMSTKIVAARLATSAGVTTVITKSSKPGNISAIIAHAEKQRSARSSNRNSVSNFQDDGVPLSQTASNMSNSNHDLSASTTSLQDPRPDRTPSPQPDEPVPLHTRFLPISNPIRDRYFWILHGLAPHGTIYIDHGAWAALSDKAGLLPVGIVDVDGHFAQQEAVRIFVVKRLSSSHSHANSPKHAASPQHQHQQTSTQAPNTPSAAAHAMHAPIPLRHPLPHSTSYSSISHIHSPAYPPAYEQHNPAPFEIGRAVVNYSATEIRRIKGLHSTQISEALGYADSEYVALRENIAFFGGERSRPGTPSLVGGGKEGVEVH